MDKKLVFVMVILFVGYFPIYFLMQKYFGFKYIGNPYQLPKVQTDSIYYSQKSAAFYSESNNKAEMPIKQEVLIATKEKIWQKKMFLSPWEAKRHFLYRPNCDAIARGNEREIQRVKQLISAHPYKQADPSDVYEWARNCSRYRQAYSLRYRYVTQEEKDFPIAFSIRMHHSVEQAELLLRHIYAPQNIYCIYIDKKSSPMIHKAMQQIASCFENVFIASILKNFYYSTVSHTKSDIRCMKDALARPERWKYFINLVGEEFPIKSNLELVRLLNDLKGKNGIVSYEIPKRLMGRILLVHKIVNGTNRSTAMKRVLPPGLVLYKGGEYSLFSREFVKWAINSTMMKQLQAIFSNGTWGSDEILWATLQRNPEAPGGNINRSARAFAKARLWLVSRRARSICKTYFFRYHCLLSISEMKWMLNQSQPFANKIKMDHHPVVIDCLSTILSRRTLKSYTKAVNAFHSRVISG